MDSSAASSTAKAPLTKAKPRSLNLRVGDWVQVKSADEILETLDHNGCLDGLPFMPEMLQYCGKQFRVYKSAHKTCNTIGDYAIRTMDDAVHLEELRCDGHAHAGCQAGCLLFWKEQWLEHADGPTLHKLSSNRTSRGSHGNAVASSSISVEGLFEATRIAPANGETEERYRCQATDLLKATRGVRRRDRWSPLFYLKDLTAGNVSLRDFAWFGLIAVFNSFTRRWFGVRYPRLCGKAGAQTPTLVLNLRPGELVQVRSKDEIMSTVNADHRNRGLLFDAEMLRFCEAGSYRVLRKVEKIIDEKTGRLIRLPNPNIILDGVTCSGTLSSSRMFCPRSIYPYWREIWLKRVEESTADASAKP
jgi:hypothetical protein